MRYVILLGCPNNRTRDRLGIIASRRLGGAVMRNRAKRRLRALFRQFMSADTGTSASFDVVAIPRRELVSAPWATLEQEFRVGLARLRAAK
jgi:ribonuclease P protein component